METLLDSLNGFGYLKRRHGRYAISKVATKWLLKSSPNSMRDAVLFMEDLWELLGEMAGRVRTGQAADFHHGGRPPEFWERYMRGLAVFARYTGGEIARKVRLERPPRRLLDVAGGFNELLFFLTSDCRAYPEATIHDWVTQTGFGSLRSTHLRAMPAAFLLSATR